MFKILIERLNDLLKHSIVFRRFLKVFSVDAFVKVGSFAFYILFARLMTARELGIFDYLFSFVASVLAPIFNLGLYVAQTKLYHELDAPKRGSLYFTINTFIGAIILIFLGISVIFDADFYIMKWVVTNESYHFNYADYRYIILSGFVISIMLVMMSGFFMTSEQIGLFNTQNIVSFVAVNLLTLTAMYFTNGNTAELRLKYFFIGQFIVLLFFYYRYLNHFRLKFDTALLRQSLKISWPTMWGAVWMFVYSFSDKWLLQDSSSFESVGTYGYAVKIASAVLIFFTSFQNIWQPLFFKEKNIAIIYQKTRRIIINMIGILIAVSVGLWVAVFVLLWLKLIAPEHYIMLYILPIMLLGRIFQSIQQLYSNYTIYFERTAINFWVGLGGNLLNLAFVIVLIPRYGIYGAAFGTFLAVLISSSTFIIIVSKFVKKNVRQSELR